MDWDEPQVSVRGLLGSGFIALEKLPDFEENNAEFEEPRPPLECNDRPIHYGAQIVEFEELCPQFYHCNGPSP